MDSYSCENLRLSAAFSISMCSLSRSMGMGGWLIIAGRKRVWNVIWGNSSECTSAWKSTCLCSNSHTGKNTKAQSPVLTKLPDNFRYCGHHHHHHYHLRNTTKPHQPLTVSSSLHQTCTFSWILILLIVIMTELFTFSTPSSFWSLCSRIHLLTKAPQPPPPPPLPPPPWLLLPPTWSLVVLAPHLHRVDQVGRHIHHQGLGLRLQHDALGLVFAPHDAEGDDGADANDEKGAAAGGGHDGQQHVLVIKLLRLLPCLRRARLDRLPATAAAAATTTARPWPPVGLRLDVGGGDVNLVGVPAGGVKSLEERRRGWCCKSRRECQVLLSHAATECAGFSFPITICVFFSLSWRYIWWWYAYITVSSQPKLSSQKT